MRQLGRLAIDLWITLDRRIVPRSFLSLVAYDHLSLDSAQGTWLFGYLCLYRRTLWYDHYVGYKWITCLLRLGMAKYLLYVWGLWIYLGCGLLYLGSQFTEGF